ncbi:MAG: helix-turn-helix transcriptional regulator [Lachnospiraceae bacterium]|nr:helix-turn-helix transcriptional regulator [Lachnospiraceae bacterium]
MDEKTIGESLRRIRKDAALSQEKVAEQAGLSQSEISNIERGTGCSLYSGERFANALSYELFLRKIGNVESIIEGNEPVEPNRSALSVLGGLGEILLLMIVYSVACILKNYNTSQFFAIAFESFVCLLFAVCTIFKERNERNCFADVKGVINAISHATVFAVLAMSPLVL